MRRGRIRLGRFGGPVRSVAAGVHRGGDRGGHGRGTPGVGRRRSRRPDRLARGAELASTAIATTVAPSCARPAGLAPAVRPVCSEPTSASAGPPGSGTPQHNRTGAPPGHSPVRSVRMNEPRDPLVGDRRRSARVHVRRERERTAVMANKALVGEKVGMTQVWDDDNRVVPVTVVRVAAAARRPGQDHRRRRLHRPPGHLRREGGQEAQPARGRPLRQAGVSPRASASSSSASTTSTATRSARRSASTSSPPATASTSPPSARARASPAS